LQACDINGFKESRLYDYENSDWTDELHWKKFCFEFWKTVLRFLALWHYKYEEKKQACWIGISS